MSNLIHGIQNGGRLLSSYLVTGCVTEPVRGSTEFMLLAVALGAAAGVTAEPCNFTPGISVNDGTSTGFTLLAPIHGA